MEQNEAERQVQDPKVNTEDKEVVVEKSEMELRLEKLESTNERLLVESKSWKAKTQDLRRKEEDEKEERVKSSNDREEYVKHLELKVNDLTETNDKTNRAVAKASLKNTVSRFAKDAYDVDDIVSKLNLNNLEYDSDSRDWVGVQDEVLKIRESKDYLFEKKGTVSMTNGLNNKPMTSEPQSLANMSANDKKLLMEKMLSEL